MSSKEGFELIKSVIPGLEGRLIRYKVDTSEVDADLIEMFFEQTDKCLESLQQAMAAKNMLDLSKAAHAIKGMGGAVGMPEVSVLAEELEMAGKSGLVERCGELINILAGWRKIYSA